jgi:ABC-type Mn2+/Zn2+ transport system permease subunit
MTPLPRPFHLLIAFWGMLFLTITPLRGNDSRTDAALDEIDRVSSSATAQRVETSAEKVEGLWPLVRFFAPALVVAAATGICGGVLGTFVLRRGEALLALSLPQAVALGVAVGLRFGWPTLPPALVAVAALLGLVAAERRRLDRRAGPTLIPALYIGALCLSFLVIAHSGQHVEELQHLFVGIDVAVSVEQAAWVAPCLILCAIVAGAYWRRWLLLAQAPAAAELAGRSVGRNHAFFMALLGTYVLLGTSTQGIVLVIAMLFLPATTVAPWTRRLPMAMLTAAALSITELAGAFALSNHFAWPLSHSLGGVGASVLALSYASHSLGRCRP